jgi:hypothetical protein
MARDTIRVWLELDQIQCHDEGDGWGSAEPYLWTVFFKIDGETVALTESLNLTGTATVIGTPGSHGNLGDTDVDAGDVITIPSAIGEWKPLLSPIPVPESLRAVIGDDLPGVVGVACVLMEEDNVTDDGAEAGHAALNGAVASALADIIATRSFSNPNITAQEIGQYMEAVSGAVSDAVKNQQSFFENLWSWLNEDDTVGSRVFFWTHDDLSSGDTISFSERWRNEGDWELFGHVNATVVCTAEAAAVASAILEAILSQVEGDMRSFRDREMGGTQLQRWWSLTERNGPELVYALRQDPQLIEAVAALLRAVPNTLKNREAQVPDDLIGHARYILQRLRDVGSRRARIDSSRALDILQHLQGKTVREAIDLLSSVPPGRTPHPVKDVRDLLNPGLRVPRSALDAIDTSSGSARGNGNRG